MATKKPNPVFELVFSGQGIYPEAIPLGTMSRILSAIHRLATGIELPEEETSPTQEKAPDEKEIQLLNVKRGSAILQFSGKSPSQVIKNLREVGTVLQHPEKIGDNIHFLHPIEELSSTARKLNCSIILREPAKENAGLAQIEGNSFESISQSVFVTGETAITGIIERVGGATVLKCGLRVTFQPRMLICGVANTEIARVLGQRLYQEAIVHGTARWVKSNWRIYSFEIRNVQQLKTGSLDEAMEALRKAGGKEWDNIEDPQEFLEESGIKQ